MTNNNRMRRRILHTADLQVESLGDKGCLSLEAVVNLALTIKIDLAIIAGDLFENNRVGNDVISFAAKQLRRLPMPVVILPGNHDDLGLDSAYHKVELWKDATNVRVFRALGGETLVLSDLGISVWGKPITSHDGRFRPLAGVPRPTEKGLWHIAVAHGYYDDIEPPIFPSFNINREEVVKSGQDYVALGHWPVFRCVCESPVKAYYCDVPRKAVNIVELTEEAGVQVTSHPTDMSEQYIVRSNGWTELVVKKHDGDSGK